MRVFHWLINDMYFNGIWIGNERPVENLIRARKK